MTKDLFDKMLENRLLKIKSVLQAKGAEYAPSTDDRLHNFKTAARYMNCFPSQALWAMMQKHVVSCEDLVMKSLKATPELIDEKLGDFINYLILLEALLSEEMIDERLNLYRQEQFNEHSRAAADAIKRCAELDKAALAPHSAKRKASGSKRKE